MIKLVRLWCYGSMLPVMNDNYEEDVIIGMIVNRDIQLINKK